MVAVHSGDDDGIGMSLIQHRIEIRIGGWVAGKVLGDVLNSLGVHIAEPYQLSTILKALRDGLAVRQISPSSGADNCDSFQSRFLLVKSNSTS